MKKSKIATKPSTTRVPEPPPPPPPPEPTSLAVNVRLPVDLVAQLDTHALHLARERPGATVTRSDALREVLLRGLASLPPATP